MGFASASDIERWANSIAARSELPHLVRRMILATANGLISISMRSGEGVQLPGWDGTVSTQGLDAHVPEGLSVWEMGVNKNPTTKANDDYEKRTQEPGDVNPAEATFVFVTPRRWSAKDTWANEKKGDNVWKDVIVYDADDLETWLERAPAVHSWFSSLIGINPYDAQSLESWWDDWSNETVPPFTPSILLSGREAAADQTYQDISDGATTSVFYSESQEEVIAFVAAILVAKSPANNDNALQKTLLVRTPDAWRQLAISEQPLVLMPLFEKPNVRLAEQHGHRVVIPLEREKAYSGRSTKLPRLRREGIETALIDSGINRDKARDLATLGRRSLLALRRRLAVSPEVQNPLWSHPEHVRAVIPALLADTWYDNKAGDQQAISELAGQPYSDYIRTLSVLANRSDLPVRQIGNVWMVISKEDTWRLVARYLTSDDLANFRVLALKVLGSEDPTVGMGSTERMFASMRGQERAYSGHLLEGIANTLALMATTSHEVVLPANRSGRSEANYVAHSLLEAASEDATGTKWISFSPVLPLLAEAAPDTFLRHMDAELQRDNPPVMKLFQDKENYDYFSSSSAHTYLLWALETLSWSTEFLGHASTILAKLSRLDPGGRLANRPFKSLTETLILWRPGTSATIPERLQVVDLLRQHEPKVAWELMFAILPSRHSYAGFPHAPSWRDWKPEADNSVLTQELIDAMDSLVGCLIEDCGIEIQRWAQIVNLLGELPPATRSRVTEALRNLPFEQLNDEQKADIRETLIFFVSKHREFPDANWSLSEDAVQQLEALIPNFEPEAPDFRHRWLFKRDSVHCFGSYRDESRHERLENARIEALTEILSSKSLTALLSWSEQFEDFIRQSIGRALRKGDRDNTFVDKMLDTLVSETIAHRVLAAGYIAQLAWEQSNLTEWMKSILSSHVQQWDTQGKVSFLLLFPNTEEIWGLVEEEGQDVDQAYWSRMRPYGYGLLDEGSMIKRVATKLLEVGRPHHAIEFLEHHAGDLPQEESAELSAQALELAVTTSPPSDLHGFSYYVDKLLNKLAEADFDQERLARLEWAWLPLFRYESRHLHVLHRELTNNPDFFVHVMSLLYTPDGEEPKETTDFDVAQAERARSLLSFWHTVPGTLEDSSIDKEALAAWVELARTLLREKGLLKIGANHIGGVLRYGPAPENDVWPAEPIKDVIEKMASDEFEDAFAVEVYNSRGVTTRGLTDGGEQERSLVAKYRAYAATASIRWPRTAALLNRIADDYESEARSHDTSAELTEDTWR